MLCDWFLPKTLSEKSKWKRQFNELVMEKEEPMIFFARVEKIFSVLGSMGVHLPVEDVNLKIVESTYRRLRIRTTYDIVQGYHHPRRNRGNSQAEVHNHV